MTVRQINLTLELNMLPVESSAIASVGHDEINRVVAVAFHSDPAKVYCYEGIQPPEPGESVGKWYHREIKAIGRTSSVILNLPTVE